MTKKKLIKLKIKKIKLILLDLFYRLKGAAMLFLLWIMLVFWRRRIESHKIKLMKFQNQMDEWQSLCSHLRGKRRAKEENKIKQMAKELLQIEKDWRKDEEGYLQNNEKLHYFLAKVFDPTIGE